MGCCGVVAVDGGCLLCLPCSRLNLMKRRKTGYELVIVSSKPPKHTLVQEVFVVGVAGQSQHPGLLHDFSLYHTA